METNGQQSVTTLEAYLAEPLPTYPEAPDEQRQTEAAEGDALRRDGDLYRICRWFFIVCLVNAAIAGVCFILWQWFPVTRVEPMVSVLEIDRDGGVAWLRPPVKMRDFVLPGEILQMLSRDFILNIRRKGKDEVDQQERQRDWHAYACGTVDLYVQSLPKLPPEVTLVSLHELQVLPTGSPRTFRASWQEWRRNSRMEVLSPKPRYVADLTFGRFAATDADTAERNPGGVCIESLNIQEVTL